MFADFTIFSFAFLKKRDMMYVQSILEVSLMAYVITDACVKCGACADACPLSAISEGDDKYVIDADTCVDCGTCAGECPNEAIVEG